MKKSSKYTRVNWLLTFISRMVIARWNIPSTSLKRSGLQMTRKRPWRDAKPVPSQSLFASSTCQYRRSLSSVENIATSLGSSIYSFGVVLSRSLVLALTSTNDDRSKGEEFCLPSVRKQSLELIPLKWVRGFLWRAFEISPAFQIFSSKPCLVWGWMYRLVVHFFGTKSMLPCLKRTRVSCPHALRLCKHVDKHVTIYRTFVE